MPKLSQIIPVTTAQPSDAVLALRNSVDIMVAANSLPALTIPSYFLTAGEIAAGVTPTNFGFPPGDPIRYGADPAGILDSSVAFTNACNANLLVTVRPANPGAKYIVHDVTIPGNCTVSAEGAQFIDKAGAAFIFKLTGFAAKLTGAYIASALNCSLGAVVFDDGNLCEASNVRVLNGTTCLRFQHTSGTCNNAQISNFIGDAFSVAGVFVGPNVANIQADNISMDCNTVAGGGGQIPKAGVTCFQLVGTGTTTNTGGHQFTNCTALNSQTGYSFTNTNLIKLNNCIADTLSGVAYQFAGSSFAIDLDDCFAGTCAAAVSGGGTSGSNKINSLRCFGTGNIPSFGGTTWYSSSGFSAPFFDLVQTGTATFTIDLDNWISSNVQFPQYAHAFSEAVPNNIAMTGGIYLTFNSGAVVPTNTAAAWIGPAGFSTTNETAASQITPPSYFTVASVARVSMNSTLAPGGAFNFNYTLRVHFGNSAITGVTAPAGFSPVFSGGPVAINPAYQVNMQVAGPNGAAAAVHYGSVLLIPQP